MAWFEHGISRIYYEEQGSGTPVLVLPGFAQSIEDFAALMEALLGAGYRVIAADLPGSGRSEPQPRTYTATYYEDDARSFAALLEHLATEPAHVIGFSDGGMTAFRYRFFGLGQAAARARALARRFCARLRSRSRSWDARGSFLGAVMAWGHASGSSLPHGKTRALNSAATNPRRPRTTQLNRRGAG